MSSFPLCRADSSAADPVTPSLDVLVSTASLVFSFDFLAARTKAGMLREGLLVTPRLDTEDAGEKAAARRRAAVASDNCRRWLSVACLRRLADDDEDVEDDDDGVGLLSDEENSGRVSIE